MASAIPQHKKIAMGDKPAFKNGGFVKMAPAKPAMLKTGIKDSPLEKSKRANGIPGMKVGGKAR